MRAFVLEIVEGIHKGLRRFAYNQRNIGALVECHNVRPTESGLEPYDEITFLQISNPV